jgi:hypothetical protein
MNNEPTLQFEIGRDGAFRRTPGVSQKINSPLKRTTHATTTIPAVNAFEIQNLIQHALDHGWIRKPDPPEIKSESHQRRQLRAQWHARGLNSHGRPRRNEPRPELRGLDRKTYQREYMKLRRKKLTRHTHHGIHPTHDETRNSKPGTRNSEQVTP